MWLRLLGSPGVLPQWDYYQADGCYTPVTFVPFSCALVILFSFVLLHAIIFLRESSRLSKSYIDHFL